MSPYRYDVSPIGLASSITIVMIAGGATMANAETIQTVTRSDYCAAGELNGMPETMFDTSSNFDMEPAVSIARNLPMARTDLGRKLLEHRMKILSQGLPLLSIDEINKIVREARGNG